MAPGDIGMEYVHVGQYVMYMRIRIKIRYLQL